MGSGILEWAKDGFDLAGPTISCLMYVNTAALKLLYKYVIYTLIQLVTKGLIATFICTECNNNNNPTYVSYFVGGLAEYMVKIIAK